MDSELILIHLLVGTRACNGGTLYYEEGNFNLVDSMKECEGLSGPLNQTRRNTGSDFPLPGLSATACHAAHRSQQTGHVLGDRSERENNKRKNRENAVLLSEFTAETLAHYGSLALTVTESLPAGGICASGACLAECIHTAVLRCRLSPWDQRKARSRPCQCRDRLSPAAACKQSEGFVLGSKGLGRRGSALQGSKKRHQPDWTPRLERKKCLPYVLRIKSASSMKSSDSRSPGNTHLPFTAPLINITGAFVVLPTTQLRTRMQR